MKILVIIPTPHECRFKLLQKVIKSLEKQTYKNFQINLVSDGNIKLYQMFSKIKCDKVKMILNDINIGWIGTMNKNISENIDDFDGFIYGADDIEFQPDCIENAVKNMKGHFPDMDGLVSIKQILSNDAYGCETAFGLIGNKFARRFPDKNPFCIDYNHWYSDFEIGLAAKFLEKYYKDETAIVLHHRIMTDETRKKSKEKSKGDPKTFERRQKRGCIWGINFSLVNG